MQIDQQIPPLAFASKCGIRDAGYESRYLEQVVDLGKVGVWKGMAGETLQDAARGERTGGEDSFGYRTRREIVTEKDDSFLGEEGI